MANNDENHSVNMLHNSGIRETRSDVCRSNNLPGYYIKRERSVRYILLEITRAHERIYTHSLNYGNCWLVNCSLRCPLGDCTETRTFTCVPLSPNAATNEKRYRGGNSFLKFESPLRRGKKKRKNTRTNRLHLPNVSLFVIEREKNLCFRGKLISFTIAIAIFSLHG